MSSWVCIEIDLFTVWQSSIHFDSLCTNCVSYTAVSTFKHDALHFTLFTLSFLTWTKGQLSVIYYFVYIIDTAASAVYTVLIIHFNILQYNCIGTLSHTSVRASASVYINLLVAHVLTCVHMETDFLNIKSI